MMQSTEKHQFTWKQYQNRSDRGLRMSAVWLEPLLAYLKGHENRERSSQMKVLDFGCGYFEMGSELGGHFFKIDGFDINTESLRVARTRNDIPARSVLYESREAIPAGFYDLIVLNSVAQYLGPEESFKETLLFLASRLSDRADSAIVLSDIIPKNYPTARDALFALFVAIKRGFLPEMVKHLAQAALRPSALQFLQLDESDLRALSNSIGFKVEKLPTNLTPSPYRQSYRLVRSAVS